MIKVSQSVVINRPVKDVFEYISHPERHHQWQSNLIEVDSDGKSGKGTKVKEVRKFMGRRVEFNGEVAEHEDGRRFSIKAHGPQNMAYERRYTFESAAGGTRVTLEFELDSKGVFKAAKPIVERMIKRDTEAGMHHLKDLLEAHEDLHESMQQVPAHKHK